MRSYPRFQITKKAERSVRAGHPWVYGEEIVAVDGAYANGDLVDVVTLKGKYLGTGFVNDHSKIRVRLLAAPSCQAGIFAAAALFSAKRTSFRV